MNTLGITIILVLAAASLLPAVTASHTGSLRDPAPTPIPEDPTPAMEGQQKIVPFLWFQTEAEDAVRFYTRIFPGAKVNGETRWGDGGPLPKGALMSAGLRLAGQEFIVLNGGPAPKFTDAISLFVRCNTQKEVDELWEKLTAEGGKPGPCGWLKDKFGVSWQVVPVQLVAMLGDKDPEKVKRVGAALVQMGKIDIQRLQQAYDGR
jgi:predicted 3-demethylubiquinone-9 3-methyltransferase (glyoxalase superfamily)